MLVTIDLPWPPSINTYWRRNGDRYFISQKGIAYRKLVMIMCAEYKDYFNETHRLRVSIDAYPPDKRKRDLDNILKSLFDSLQEARVFPDDSQIDKLTVTRKDSGLGIISVSISSDIL